MLGKGELTFKGMNGLKGMGMKWDGVTGNGYERIEKLKIDKSETTL